MPTIDFYLLETDKYPDEYHASAYLLENMYNHDTRIFVACKNQATVNMLDDLLWSYRADSFLPHGIYGTCPSNVPIQIGQQPSSAEDFTILFNLSDKIMDNYQIYKEIIHIIPRDEQQKNISRMHYRQYRTCSTNKLTMHNLA